MIVMFLGWSLALHAQDYSYEVSRYSISPFGKIHVATAEEGWGFRINHLEGIREGNATYRQQLMQLKTESAARFPRKEVSLSKGSQQSGNLAPTPSVLRNFEGNLYSMSAPNDNTLAVSDGGQLISAINTNIYFYDLNTDSLMKAMSLNNFSSGLSGISTHQYDPKLLYDPEMDRFIIVFLAGASSDTKTNIVVGFSESNDMLGNWNVYSLPGNPLNDTSWTDYPAIALTRDELFITVNLLNYGTSWQTSFKQTVVWQVDKKAGYAGDELGSKLWKNIAFDGVNIRNLNPIQGGDRLYGPNIYLLSNRNFTVYSDSLFLLEITGNLKNPDAELKITLLKANPGYGAPPDAKQPKTTNVLATNDARVLGGFLHNNTIQFVANTIDTLTGTAAIYHGHIHKVSQFPTSTGKVLTEPGMEFGYPNIAYTGNTLFSQQAMIGFNHTGDTALPGVSAIYYDGRGNYSSRLELKTGSHIINIFTGLYERWGDYTGIQRKYNEPGKVWISGMFGYKVGMAMRLGTQIAEVVSPESEIPDLIKSRKLEASLYPNPTSDYFGMEFVLEDTRNVIIELRSMSGQRVHRFFEGEILAGKNALTFYTQNLSYGTYIVVIQTSEGEILFSEKLIKASR